MDQVWTGDCLRHLAELPEASVDLAFADPPFNIGYEYDVYNDRQTREEYLAWTERWLAAVRRVLKADGSFYVAIGDEYVAELKVRLDALGLVLRNWIVWHYTFGVNCQRKFNRSHAHILYYVRDEKRFTFNAAAVRVPSARQTTYADRRANPTGKLPDDTWVLRPQEDARCFAPEGDTWYAARVCGTFKERTGHPCQMPEAVLERIVARIEQSGRSGARSVRGQRYDVGRGQAPGPPLPRHRAVGGIRRANPPAVSRDWRTASGGVKCRLRLRLPCAPRKR